MPANPPPSICSTLLPPDEGSAPVCGHILGREDQQIRRKIGIVYQQNVLDELLTVRENLMCRGLLHGITRTQARAQLDKLTNLLKLEDILKSATSSSPADKSAAVKSLQR